MKSHWKIDEATCWPAQGVGQSVVGEGRQGSTSTLVLYLEEWVKIFRANIRRKAIPTREINNANTIAFADKAADTASFTIFFLE